MRYAGLLILFVLTVACAGAPSPASLEYGIDVCAHCRKTVNDSLFAAQIVASGTEPVFFDDIACLSEYLSRNTRLGPRAIAYVTDHQTGEWIVAATALYTRNLQLATPAQSHLVAHGSVTTQAADPVTRNGSRVNVKELALLDMPDGRR